MTADPTELGQKLITYCGNFAVPIEHIFDILNDQKVVPMIRGKATEYHGYLEVIRNLSSNEWTIQKLNLNAQTGIQDQDIQITHRRTGLILRVECKSAVRGSMRAGARSKKCRVPHFHVKCHRSRSNIKLAGTTNDRYSVDSFDVIVCNVSNALFQGGTFGAELELLHDRDMVHIVAAHYGVSTDKEIIEHAYSDWRFVFPRNISEGGFVPRTPIVCLADDPNWKPMAMLDESITALVRERRGR